MLRVGQALEGRDNALNAVRLALASLVVVYHCAPTVFSTWNGLPLGTACVVGFFALSGYLITGSAVRLPAREFLWRRALRILPGFWVCLVVVAFVVAPLSTVASGRSWDAGSAAGYVWRNAALWIFQQNITDTIEPGPVSWWNGPLWSLSYEFAAYLAAVVLLGVGLVRRRVAPVCGLLLVGVCVVHALARGPLEITGSVPLTALQLSTAFLAGMVMWGLRDRLPVTLVLLAVAAAASVGLVWAGLGPLLASLPIAYLVLGLGALLPMRIGTRNDVSYGVYIYGWPVMTLFLLAGWTFGGPAAFTAAVLGSTLLVAAGSWWLVERPAMRLRGRFGVRSKRARGSSVARHPQHPAPARSLAIDDEAGAS